MSLEDKAKTLYYLREKSVKYEPSNDPEKHFPELKDKWVRFEDAQKFVELLDKEKGDWINNYSDLLKEYDVKTDILDAVRIHIKNLENEPVHESPTKPYGTYGEGWLDAMGYAVKQLVEIVGSENKPRTSPLRKNTEATGGGEDFGDNRKVSLSLSRKPSDEPEKYIVHIMGGGG